MPYLISYSSQSCQYIKAVSTLVNVVTSMHLQSEIVGDGDCDHTINI